jgi:hypothetical protein
MRLRNRVIGGFVVGLTLVSLGSPVAQADDASFVRAVKSLGFVQTSPNLVSIAKSACYMLSLNNRIRSEIEDRIQRYTRVTPEQAHQFFVSAVNEYCPQYIGVVGP